MFWVPVATFVTFETLPLFIWGLFSYFQVQKCTFWKILINLSTVRAEFYGMVLCYPIDIKTQLEYRLSQSNPYYTEHFCG